MVQSPDHNFVSVDAKLDPNGELLPVQRYIELCSAAARRSCRLVEQTEQRVLDSIQLNAESSPIPMGPDDNDLPLAILVLGKFGLVWSQAIFAGPETQRSHPWYNFWDQDQDRHGLSILVWSRSRPGPDGPCTFHLFIYSRSRTAGLCGTAQRPSPVDLADP